MIEVGPYSLSLEDPLVIAGLAGAGILLLILILLVLAVTRAGRSVRMAEPLAAQVGQLSQAVQLLAQGQTELRGSLQTVSDSSSSGQARLAQLVEQRLSGVQSQMQDRLAENAMRSQRALAEMQEKLNAAVHGSSKQTATSLTALQERLAVIDKAQDNITKLSGDVLSLQDILSNKQTRGAFGEIQLNDIVSKALPPDSYCLIHLPNPPGPIVIDSKFPLEAYEKLRNAGTDAEVRTAAQQMRTALRAHIRAISERYIIEGETADGALMFLPSEAVYAELHANFPDLVREGFDARVWIVSPTTCMATLNTMRAILKDARMREQAGTIRKELTLLHKDVERLGDRVGNLDRHFGQAARDIEEIKISAEKAGKRARRLDAFDFAEVEEAETVVPLQKSERS